MGRRIVFLLMMAVLLAVFMLCGCHCRRGYAAEGETQWAESQESRESGRTATASSSEQFIGGSFLGALFFGYPYKGIGIVDIAAGGILLLLVARMAARKRGSAGKGGSFDVRNYPANRSGSETPTPPGDTRPDLAKRPGPSEGRPQQPEERESGNPYDNAWSRRMGSSGQEREGGNNTQGWNAGNRNAGAQPSPTMKDRAAAMWAYYGGAHRGVRETGQEAAVAPGVEVPRDFDVADFLEGARTLYVRLQQAWAARKVDELEPFVSPQLLELLRKQAAGNPEPVSVDILLVEAELAAVSRDGEEEKASVNFSVSMRSGTDSTPKDIRELWRFARGPESGGMWRLEGIGQAQTASS